MIMSTKAKTPATSGSEYSEEEDEINEETSGEESDGPEDDGEAPAEPVKKVGFTRREEQQPAKKEEEDPRSLIKKLKGFLTPKAVAPVEPPKKEPVVEEDEDDEGEEEEDDIDEEEVGILLEEADAFLEANEELIREKYRAFIKDLTFGKWKDSRGRRIDKEKVKALNNADIFKDFGDLIYDMFH